jgi:ABC-2 type transport system ATP-binding protein
MLRYIAALHAHPVDPVVLEERLGLSECGRTPYRRLSGGQKQRLGLAMALIGRPQVVFVDEPTAGLDPAARHTVWELFAELRADGVTVVLTTHYMDEAERLCDRVAVVDQGLVIALGTPAELIARLGGQHVIDFSLADSKDPPPVEEFAALPSVISARIDAGRYGLTVAEPHAALPALLRHLQQNGREVATLTTRHATLEDVFVNLTGRHLRDDE